MLIIGCDYHPSVQQIAWVDTETGETRERRLKHSDGEAERFYRELKEKGFRVRVGMEATGHARWFERLLAELDFELWVGDPGRIRAKQVKKQKNDRRDAEHILQLLMKDDFPRLWMPTPENRDVRQLVLHRHRLVGMRTRVMNQLQAIAMNEGVRRKRGLWSKQGRAQLESLSLPPWTSHRRQELLELLDRFDPSIDQLSQAIEQEAEEWPEVKRLLTHPGVGPITALAFVLVIGTPHRFRCGKQVASYLGLVPSEDSSADRQRLGHISKQGNAMLRHLLGQAAQSVARCDEQWRGQYVHLAQRRNRAIAKVAMARKLAVRLFWMWRKGWDYQQLKKFGSHVGQLVKSHGVE
jgi:transposase